MSEPAGLHPFAAIAGTWRGRGKGEYPTIESFEYLEELVIEPVPGRPVAHWRSRTRDATTNEPRHGESGFLRAAPGGVEFVVAHSFGIGEVAAGQLNDVALDLDSRSLTSTESAKTVDRVERRYEFKEQTLTYTIAMSAVGHPLTHHLQATLGRATEEPQP